MEWKTDYIANLPMKGGLSDCPNWRRIQLFSLPSKVIKMLVLERIRKFVDIRLREEQGGFRADMSCTDPIVTLHHHHDHYRSAAKRAATVAHQFC